MAFQSVLISILSLLFHDKMQMDLSLTGTIISVVTVMGAVGIYGGGGLAHCIGEARTIRILLGLGGVVFGIASIVSASIPFCLLFLMAIFCMMAVGPAIETVISNSVDDKLYKKVFSFTYLGSNIGYGIFVLIITRVYQKYLSCICILGMVICIVLLLIFGWYEKINDVVKKEDIEVAKEKYNFNITWWQLLRENGMLLLTIVFFCIIYSQYGFTIPLQLNQSWGETGVSLYGILGVINAVVVILCTPALTAILDRRKEKDILSTAGFIYGSAFVLLCFLGGKKWIYIIWMICFTIAEILYSISVPAYIARYNQVEERKLLYTMSNVCVLLGYVMGQNFSGILGQYNIILNFTVMVAVCVVCSLLCKFRLKN